MNCIIIDDEPNAIDVLKRYVDQTTFLQLKQTFRNPVKALGYLKEEKVDLIFLDINMPNLSGIQFVRSLEHKPMIIFTTAYADYAVESYELNVADYLLKPIEFDRFIKAVNKASDLFQSGKNQTNPNAGHPKHREDDNSLILLKSGAVTHKVRLKEILFIVKEENYIVFQTNENKIYVRANMSEIFDYVPVSQFCRVHKSFVVALSHIRTFEVHQLMVGKYKIPIGAGYRQDLMVKVNA